MSTALVKIAPRTVDEASTFAELAAKSAMLPPALRNKPADVFAILLTGMELGLGPMQALRSIHIIQGRPVMAAELLIGLAKRHPDCLYFQLVYSGDDKAVYKTQRRGDPEPTTLEYTMDQAKRAGLSGKDNWKAHTAAMLRARAGSSLARAVYPDAILGLYATEEMTSEPDAEDAVFEEPAATVEVAAHEQPLKTVDFPVLDESNDEREKMLAAEKLIRENNKDELHRLVNEVMSGDEKKSARKATYAGFGLRAANPIKEFLGLTLDEQQAILLKVRSWHAVQTSPMPDWAGGDK